MTTAEPITTVEQAIDEANRQMRLVRPGCTVQMLPGAMRLLIEAAKTAITPTGDKAP